MTHDNIKNVLTKVLNSPLITKRFPNVDKVEVREVEERLSYPDSVILRLNVYLKGTMEKHRIFFLDDFNPYCMDLLKTLGIGGAYNYIYYNLIDPDDTK